jgi:CHAT domain-containing protein
MPGLARWAVNSEATIHVITKTFDELKKYTRIGRAEALRRSMLALISKGGGYARRTGRHSWWSAKAPLIR